ncbi:MAG: hypothetical protein ACE5OZ_10720 [Candidatus Heimdallarchaeota archaeon]
MEAPLVCLGLEFVGDRIASPRDGYKLYSSLVSHGMPSSLPYSLRTSIQSKYGDSGIDFIGTRPDIELLARMIPPDIELRTRDTIKHLEVAERSLEDFSPPLVNEKPVRVLARPRLVGYNRLDRRDIPFLMPYTITRGAQDTALEVKFLQQDSRSIPFWVKNNHKFVGFQGHFEFILMGPAEAKQKALLSLSTGVGQRNCKFGVNNYTLRYDSQEI